MKIKNIKFLKDKDGAVIVIVAICLTAIIAVTALAIDVGSLYGDKRQLQTVADSAALAGAQELPERPLTAVDKAYHYAEMNGLEPENIEVTITDTGRGVDNDKIIVDVINPESPLYFGRIFGNVSSAVAATASATANSPLSMSGLMPWTIPMEDYPDGLKSGQTYDMKVGPNSITTPGFFQMMGFDGPGAQTYYNTIINGCQTEIFIGQSYPVQTGVIQGKTKQGVEDRIGSCTCSFGEVTDLIDGVFTGDDPSCPRIVFVPLIDERPSNPSQQPTIIGFAIFYLEDGVSEGPGNITTVKGRFLDSILANSSGDVSAYTWGVKVIRLVK